MRKRKSMICIVTAVILMLTMTGTGVFAGTVQTAGDEENTPAVSDEVTAVSDEQLAEGVVSEDAVTEDMAIQEEEPVAGTEDEITSEGPGEGTDEEEPEPEEPEEYVLNPVTDLVAVSGDRRIKLHWTAARDSNDKKAKYYIVKRSVYGKDKYKTLQKSLKKCVYVDKSVKFGQMYTYKVIAVTKDANGKLVKSEEKKVSKRDVRGMTVTVTIKVSKTIHSHGGKKQSLHIRKGQKIVTTGFGGGKWSFKHNGSRFTVARISVRSAKADYILPKNETPANVYTTEDAEYYINHYMKKKHYRTGKKYMVWVNLYTQHLFVMKKEKGKWVATDMNWEISSGKAMTPSPTGDRHIQKGIASRHAVKYWLCYSNYNALHGVRNFKNPWGNMKMKGKFGRLMSHGCVRSPNSKQKILWNTLGGHSSKGTWVIID